MPPRLADIPSLATHLGKFVCPLQLARYTGTPIRSIYYYLELGIIPAVRRGGRLKIRIEDARQYAAEPRPKSDPLAPVSVQPLHG